jgi:tetratricopeptide (TPR) repeat protein
LASELEYNLPMAEQQYPDYVQRMMEEAEHLLTDQEDPGPCEAAGVCFDILALFPEHEAAQKLIERAYRDGNLIRDNRRALSRLIDEWDDRPWQQRRRLALSFGYVSRWEEKYQDQLEDLEREGEGPEDVKTYLHTGHLQLLEDYLGGQVKGAEGAWQIFQEAIRLSKDPPATMFWVGKEYAQQGYFAEAVDVLEELLRRFPDHPSARRLWVEVRWWRDHQGQIPWIPPIGDGSRFRRMMLQTDPEALAAIDSPESILNQYRPPDRQDLPPGMKGIAHIPEDLSEKMSKLFDPSSERSVESPVDWSYLDAIERREIDVSKFPKWAQKFLDHIEDPEQRKYAEAMLMEQFSNKSLYDDAYFEEDGGDDEDVDDSHPYE